MRARKATGQYSSHNTPGDGTGFSKMPEEDAQAFLQKQRPERNSTDFKGQGAERHTPASSGPRQNKE